MSNTNIFSHSECLLFIKDIIKLEFSDLKEKFTNEEITKWVEVTNTLGLDGIPYSTLKSLVEKDTASFKLFIDIQSIWGTRTDNMVSDPKILEQFMECERSYGTESPFENLTQMLNEVVKEANIVVKDDLGNIDNPIFTISGHETLIGQKTLSQNHKEINFLISKTFKEFGQHIKFWRLSEGNVPPPIGNLTFIKEGHESFFVDLQEKFPCAQQQQQLVEGKVLYYEDYEKNAFAFDSSNAIERYEILIDFTTCHNQLV